MTVKPATIIPTMLCGLLALSACSSMPHASTATPSDADAETIKENCTLARERQNEAAIAHWCGGR